MPTHRRGSVMRLRAPARKSTRRSSHRRRSHNALTLPGLSRHRKGFFVTRTGRISPPGGYVGRGSHRLNPRRRRRSSARRSSTRVIVLRSPSRRRRSHRRARGRRSNPFRARRSYRRRAHPITLYKRHRRARRHSSNPFRSSGGGRSRFGASFRGLLSMGTWGKVAFGLGGLGVAFGAPKLLAYSTGYPSLQRGLGGVVTSGISGTLVSGLVGMVSASAGSSMLVGSLIGTSLLGLSALLGASRAQVFPVEEALLAASLPTMGPAATTPQLSAAAQTMYTAFLQAGMSPDAAQAQVKALGLSDYYSGRQLPQRTGASDYYTGGAPTTKTLPNYFDKVQKF